MDDTAVKCGRIFLIHRTMWQHSFERVTAEQSTHGTAGTYPGGEPASPFPSLPSLLQVVSAGFQVLLSKDKNFVPAYGPGESGRGLKKINHQK